MTNPSDVLFRPLQIRSLSLPNRVVMAPMTRSSAPNGLPGTANAAYYTKRARGGVGLILTEGTVVQRPASRNDPGIPFFHTEALTGWQDVVTAVHEAGGKIGPQLWHVGALKNSRSDWEPESPVESPSGRSAPETPRGVTMSDEAIAETISAFGQAAADAKRLGFDMVEIHGAHGYLIDQFFWHGTNQRTDAYGGETIRQRSRFAAEIVAAVRTAVGPDLAISLRVSQWKQQDFTVRLAETPDEMKDWLLPLVDAGVDILDCSQRRFWEPEFPEIDGENGLNFAGWAKKLTGARTISVGSVGLSNDTFAAFQGQGAEAESLDRLFERMARDEFDLIAVGRALLTDPDWTNKVRDGDELKGFETSSLAELV